MAAAKQGGGAGDAGAGYKFKVGGGKEEVEDILLVYARSLVVTLEDHKRLGLRGLLRALASNEASAISQDNEAAARALLAVVLSAQLQSMLCLSSLEDDLALLQRLQGGEFEASSGRGDNQDGERGGRKVQGDMPNMFMCLRYRIERKKLLASATANLRHGDSSP